MQINPFLSQIPFCLEATMPLLFLLSEARTVSAPGEDDL